MLVSCVLFASAFGVYLSFGPISIERIAQVKECVAAHEDRVLDVLHMHNYDVAKTITSFLDGM